MTNILYSLYYNKFFVILALVFLFRLGQFCDTYDAVKLLSCGERGNASPQTFTPYYDKRTDAVNVTYNSEKLDENPQADNLIDRVVLEGREHLSNIISSFRLRAIRNVRKYVPSPHSELLLGVLIGINDLKSVPRFNDVVRTTGTIHVIVVSGYNITLVFNLVIKLIGSQYRSKNLITALLVTLIYAVIAGFDAPVVRAWIMGAVVAFGKYRGRNLPVVQVLVFSALVMLVVDPLFIFSLSFQLSFLATLGLVLYSALLEHVFAYIFKLKNIFIEDLTSTVSAQLLVWPLISYKFEQVSLISPVVNALILWTIPLATILGGLFLFLTYLSAVLAGVFSYIIMVPLDIFVRVSIFFSEFAFSVVSYKPSINFIIVYYVLILITPLVIKPSPPANENN
jgi:competence protein ComEC